MSGAFCMAIAISLPGCASPHESVARQSRLRVQRSSEDPREIRYSVSNPTSTNTLLPFPATVPMLSW
jgi:hypothetical protein